jgi:ABC-type multidrug transport system fused ATPase/permease subunit
MAEPLPVARPRSAPRLRATYLWPQRGAVLLLALTLPAGIGLQLVNPQLIRYFVDLALAGDSLTPLMHTALLSIGVALVTQLLAIATTYLSERIAWMATNALRTDLAAHCLSLDLAFHKLRTSGELIERIDGDVTALGASLRTA